MFHVAPLMPSQNNDKQQVLRKKHIGNGKKTKIMSCIIITTNVMYSYRYCLYCIPWRKSDIQSKSHSIPIPSCLHYYQTWTSWWKAALEVTRNCCLLNIVLYSNILNQIRVEVLRNSNVVEFGPTLPSPPLFNDDDTLKEYLISKRMMLKKKATLWKTLSKKK